MPNTAECFSSILVVTLLCVSVQVVDMLAEAARGLPVLSLPAFVQAVQQTWRGAPQNDLVHLLLYVASLDVNGSGLLPVSIVGLALSAPLGFVRVVRAFQSTSWTLRPIRCAPGFAHL